MTNNSSYNLIVKLDTLSDTCEYLTPDQFITEPIKHNKKQFEIKLREEILSQ